MKRIICTVTNDLNYDQRMRRICNSLAQQGYSVLLVGRERKNSKPLENQSFDQHRLKCWFDKGKLFYAEYNLRLLFYLLRSKADAIHIVDLDTMVPGVFAGRLKGWKKVYDAHEYFTQLEEVMARPRVRKIWSAVESWGVPKCDAAITISDGYAQLFQQVYPLSFQVVRNVTILRDLPENQNRKYILYQGAVNHGRGLESSVLAMKNVDAQLVICGGGDIYDALVQLVKQEGLQDKVTLTGYLTPDQLLTYTRQAKIGLTLFENKGLSNQYSLANRFFDYFHNAVPQLAMAYPEYQSFNAQFEVAQLIDQLSPESIADGLNQLLKDEVEYEKMVAACHQARSAVNWQKEAETLAGVYERLLA